MTSAATLALLRQRIQRLEGGPRAERPVLPFGLAALDDRLPGGGLAAGALHEVAGGGHGVLDAAAAALFVAGIAARTEGPVLWCLTAARDEVARGCVFRRGGNGDGDLNGRR